MRLPFIDNYGELEIQSLVHDRTLYTGICACWIEQVFEELRGKGVLDETIISKYTVPELKSRLAVLAIRMVDDPSYPPIKGRHKDPSEEKERYMQAREYIETEFGFEDFDYSEI